MESEIYKLARANLEWHLETSAKLTWTAADLEIRFVVRVRIRARLERWRFEDKGDGAMKNLSVGMEGNDARRVTRVGDRVRGRARVRVRVRARVRVRVSFRISLRDIDRDDECLISGGFTPAQGSDEGHYEL